MILVMEKSLKVLRAANKAGYVLGMIRTIVRTKIQN